MRVEPVKESSGWPWLVLAAALASLSFGVCAVDLYNMNHVSARDVRESGVSNTRAVVTLLRDAQDNIAALKRIASGSDTAADNAREALRIIVAEASK